MNFLSLTTVFVATFVFTSASVSVNNPFYCFSQDPIRPQNGMYATQTAYDVTRGAMVNPAVSSCRPTKFWLASRHGGRMPDTVNLQRMIAFAAGPTQGNIVRNYNAGRTSLCAGDMELIENWTFDSNITIAFESFLTVAGWNVMQDLARRYQTAFPTLLPATFNAQQYFFRHTDRQRSQGSIRAFADGLFGFNGFQNVTFETIPTTDSFLRPHDNCPAYTTASTVVPEMVAFENGPEYREMMLQVNTRLGFSGSSQLNSQEIKTIWEFCRFEQGTNLQVASAWCAAFSIANHAVLEYENDLGYFYRAGYGGAPRRLYENLNCNLMQDMLRYLQSTNPNDQLAKIFGTHSTALQLFLVSLGVFNDANSLHRHNYAQQTFRQWKSSFLTPKGANLAVIRYDCADGDNDVVFYYNERPLIIPGCQTNGLCKVNMILERYSRFLNANCANLFCSTN